MWRTEHVTSDLCHSAIKASVLHEMKWVGDQGAAWNLARYSYYGNRVVIPVEQSVAVKQRKERVVNTHGKWAVQCICAHVLEQSWWRGEPACPTMGLIRSHDSSLHTLRSHDSPDHLSSVFFLKCLRTCQAPHREKWERQESLWTSCLWIQGNICLSLHNEGNSSYLAKCLEIYTLNCCRASRVDKLPNQNWNHHDCNTIFKV